MESVPAGDGSGAAWFGVGRFPNREAIAEYLLENKDKVRAIARRKLTAKTRTVFDSEDVFSSVLRRVDALASEGNLRLGSEAEFWALVGAIANNNAVNRTRLIERARSRLTEDGPYAYELLKRLNAYSSDDQATVLVLRMMSFLSNEEDRRLLSLLHRGAAHRAIGALLGTSEEASRQRWARIRRELTERFAQGALDG